MRKAECDKVRNDGGNFGQPLEWDDEMKTNDGGMKENVEREIERERKEKRGRITESGEKQN
jgi:hypothetical protein